ncbi:hypothetical protein TNCV_1333441 [Trichonephila clavipes]|nr:hypothetical protein TNCV_1333441 [Trichonephila clavipes]
MRVARASHLSFPSTNHTRGLAARRLFSVPPCRKGTIHLQTSMPSPGFKPSPYDNAVSVANHSTGCGVVPLPKSVDFHDTENRQRLRRMIMWHIKDLSSASLAWILSEKLKDHASEGENSNKGRNHFFFLEWPASDVLRTAHYAANKWNGIKRSLGHRRIARISRKEKHPYEG